MQLTCHERVEQLVVPLQNARRSWGERSILEVHLRDGAATMGVGEASPLVDYSPDTWRECLRALSAISDRLVSELSAMDSVEHVTAGVRAALPEGLPAARFGLETALLDALAQRRGVPLWRLLSDKAKGAGVPCRLCAVLPSKPAAALAQAKRLFSAGVSTFKIKVGPSRLTENQKATLSSLREALGSRVALRVDANGSFAQSEVDAVMHQLRRYSPEFVEEPIMTPAPTQVGGWACPTALDESLARLDAPSRAELIEAGCRVLVLKPTVLGGLARCLSLAHHARELGAEIVVSHTLEGRVGWTACAQLALALSSPLAAGLWPMSHQSRVGDDRIEGGTLLPTAAVGLGTPFAL